MADQGFMRKLSAIPSADVKGSSKLMGDDQEVTVRTLKAYRFAIKELAEQYRGRIFGSLGATSFLTLTEQMEAICARTIQSAGFPRAAY
jgi:hypothetical protein